MAEDGGRRIGGWPLPPKWVWLVVVGLASIEPVLHFCITRFPPEGAVASGLHTVDTGSFLSAMRYYGDDFYSPYASCESPYGRGDPSYYSLPHHHLYGVIGIVGRFLGIAPFHFLALANGVGVAFMLLAAYVLFHTTVPRLANRAFLFYALGGGFGGVLYLLAALLNLDTHENFTEYFQRYFLYELSEGPRFQPYLLVARLYYALPLGLGFLGLAGLASPSVMERRMRRGAVYGAFALCAFINFRIGPMLWLVAMFYLLSVGRPRCLGQIVAVTCATVLGIWPALWMTSSNPELIAGATQHATSALWLSPFIATTLLHWFVTPGALVRGLNGLPRYLRIVAWAGLGYCIAFGVLYVLYQVYYGNLWRSLDATVALRMCDWALLGGPVGAYFALRRKVAPGDDDAPPAWVALWLLVFFIAAVSAFGQGWYLRFSPDRFMVVLGVPLAILFTDGLDRLGRTRARFARTLAATTVVFGLASIVVTWSVSYGPLGERSLQRAFPWTHYAFISEADGRLLERLEEGVVLAPSLGNPLFGDVVVQRAGLRTVYGNATIDYSRQVMPRVRRDVLDFYSAGTDEQLRHDLVQAWCVHYVFCPDTDAVAPEVIEELRALSWLEQIGSDGGGVVFGVRLDGVLAAP